MRECGVKVSFFCVPGDYNVKRESVLEQNISRISESNGTQDMQEMYLSSVFMILSS